MSGSEIDVKQAARAAFAYLQLLEDMTPIDGIRLEEVEHDDTGDWLITLSSVDPSDKLRSQSGSPLFGWADLKINPDPRRIYRIFRVDQRSGEVISMKLRTLQSVD